MNYQSLFKASLNANRSDIRLNKFKNKCQQERRDNFQNGRKITISPVRGTEQPVIIDKENISASKTNIITKIKKQEAYCAKYLAWKTEKEKRKMEEKMQKKKPFYTACTKVQENTNDQKVIKSFASESHKFSIKGIVPIAPTKKKSDKETATTLKKENIKTNHNFAVPSIITKKTINNNTHKNNINTMSKKNPPFTTTTQSTKMPIKSNLNMQLVTVKSSIKPTTTSTKILANPKPKPIIEPSTSKIIPKQQNKLKQPITKLKTTTIKSNLLKCQQQELLKNNKKQNIFKFSAKKKANTPVSETPNENPDHPYKSLFTSTQRKQSLNNKQVSRVSDELIDTTISPIDFMDNNNDAKYLIDLNPIQNTIVYPSPIIKSRKSSLATGAAATSEIKLNYVSPYVSIARGKVSAKKEKEKRNSCYLLETTSPGESNINIRRMKEAVRRFHKLLNDEIERLENLINIWNEYIKINIIMLNENGCIDMINATLGQTRLLLTKKFQQFRELIEKCEMYALRNKDSKYNNNENDDEKAIYPEDLEGFWAMINIQVEDIDKRFDNITKWKNNNWIDPEYHPEKTKKLSSKSIVCKKPTKIQKTSHKMENYLRQLIMEQKKKKNNEENDDIILVPTRRSNRRISKSTTPGFKIKTNKSIDETPRRKTRSEWQCVNLLKPENIDTITTTPVQQSRKSILKTPGTLRKNYNVIFDEQLDFKSPDKMNRKRSLNLRSRKLMVDPEFETPL